MHPLMFTVLLRFAGFYMLKVNFQLTHQTRALITELRAGSRDKRETIVGAYPLRETVLLKVPGELTLGVS